MLKKSKVKPIYSYNIDWYQWGLNSWILDYDKDTVAKILEIGLENYDGTNEDANFFWEGYYSKY